MAAMSLAWPFYWVARKNRWRGRSQKSIATVLQFSSILHLPIYASRWGLIFVSTSSKRSTKNDLSGQPSESVGLAVGQRNLIVSMASIQLKRIEKCEEDLPARFQHDTLQQSFMDSLLSRYWSLKNLWDLKAWLEKKSCRASGFFWLHQLYFAYPFSKASILSFRRENPKF